MMNYSASWTQMCNRALGRLGAASVSDLSEGSKNAEFCNTFLTEALQEVLGQYDWSCCRKRVRLAPDVTRPAFGFLYRYVLPVNCIRIVSVYRGHDDPAEGDAIPYTVESGYILTDAGELELIYIERPEEPGMMSPAVRKAVSTTLAALLATPLTSSEQLAARVYGESAAALERAKTDDAQESWDGNEEGVPWYEEARR
jgi:hypothetical protein